MEKQKMKLATPIKPKKVYSSKRQTALYVKPARPGKVRAPVCKAADPDTVPMPRTKRKLRTVNKQNEQPVIKEAVAERALVMLYTPPPEGGKPGPYTQVLFKASNHGQVVTTHYKTKCVNEKGELYDKESTTKTRVRAKKEVAVRVTEGNERNGLGVVHSLPAGVQLAQVGDKEIVPGTRIRFAGGTALTHATVCEVY